MMEETLFSNNVKRPLADRLRPQSLKEVVGQEHIVGDDAPLGRMIKRLPPLFSGGLPAAEKQQSPV